uniref:protein-tyrosine-phosphatase n=1 Tax=Heterorhabditis bacteriophora TaxID=37862 RepID=A0A1I7X0V2_HETBA
MSSLSDDFFLRGLIEEKHQEDGDSRDSGICSNFDSPEKKTNVVLSTFEASSEENDGDWENDAIITRMREEECFNLKHFEHLNNTQRKPFSDQTNTSSSWSGNGCSSVTNARSAKIPLFDSPLTSRQPPPRLLTASMFPSDSEEEQERKRYEVTRNMSTFSTSEMSFNASSSATSIHTSERTQSVDHIHRKRSTESFSEERERKRSRAILLDVDDMDMSNLENSVFLHEDDSPNSSYVSSSSVALPRIIARAKSTGDIGKGEHRRRSHSPPPPNVTPEVIYSLPGVEKPQKESLAYRSISAATLAGEIWRLGESGFREKYTLIDCRYPYEYEGGHIKSILLTLFVLVYRYSIVNLVKKEDLGCEQFCLELVMDNLFYCLVITRAHALRSLDRKRNELSYPKVDYMEMYLLDRGYRKLWETETFRVCWIFLHITICDFAITETFKCINYWLRYYDSCQPCSYVPMTDSSHTVSLSKFKWHKSKSASQLLRAAGGSDRPVVRRGGLMTRHRSLIQVNTDVETTSYSSAPPSPLPLICPKQRLNFEGAAESPENSSTD